MNYIVKGARKNSAPISGNDTYPPASHRQLLEPVLSLYHREIGYTCWTASVQPSIIGLVGGAACLRVIPLPCLRFSSNSVF